MIREKSKCIAVAKKLALPNVARAVITALSWKPSGTGAARGGVLGDLPPFQDTDFKKLLNCGIPVLKFF